MDTSFENNRDALVRELARSGLTVSEDAWRPLQRIDFQRLVAVHDHEEAFLRATFINSLEAANRARSPVASPVSANDVRTAMLMLGAAVAAAPPSTISAQNQSIIRDVCPYC